MLHAEFFLEEEKLTSRQDQRLTRNNMNATGFFWDASLSFTCMICQLHLKQWETKPHTKSPKHHFFCWWCSALQIKREICAMLLHCYRHHQCSGFTEEHKEEIKREKILKLENANGLTFCLCVLFFWVCCAQFIFFVEEMMIMVPQHCFYSVHI